MQAVTCEQDFYSDAFIADPYVHYAEMRTLGPVLWLEQQQAYAVARYDEVVEVLRHPDIFQSGKGVALNDDVNAMLIGSTLHSDGEMHHASRRVTSRPLMPRNIAPLEDYIRDTAQALADKLVAQERFDAVPEFAQILPLSIVIDLVGLDDSGRAQMPDWAAATFDLMADDTPRSRVAFQKLVELQEYLGKYGQAKYLKEGGLARRIFEVGPEAGFDEAKCAQLMRDYIAPSLDTTISVSAYLPYLFAKFPDQWDLLRAQPDLIPNAVEEAVRMATPIRAFSRYVGEDTELAGVALKEGARIVVIYSSANRDERFWDDPDRFDITRELRKHVGFGHGVHTCMGLHLARREMINLLEAMRARVKRWHLEGAPVLAKNNTIHAFAELPMCVEAL